MPRPVMFPDVGKPQASLPAAADQARIWAVRPAHAMALSPALGTPAEREPYQRPGGKRRHSAHPKGSCPLGPANQRLLLVPAPAGSGGEGLAAPPRVPGTAPSASPSLRRGVLACPCPAYCPGHVSPHFPGTSSGTHQGRRAALPHASGPRTHSLQLPAVELLRAAWPVGLGQDPEEGPPAGHRL